MTLACSTEAAKAPAPKTGAFERSVEQTLSRDMHLVFIGRLLRPSQFGFGGAMPMADDFAKGPTQ